MHLKALLKKPFSGTSARQRHRSLLLGAAVGVVVALLCMANSDHAWLRFAENLVQRSWMDSYYSTYSEKANEEYVTSSSSMIQSDFSEHLALVVFDDSSLRSGLQWPISRSLYKEIVRKLQLAGAKTIAFDIIFSGPSQDSQADADLTQAIADAHVIMPYGLMGDETAIKRGLLYPPLIANWKATDRQHRLGFTLEVADPIDKRVRLAVLKVMPPEGVKGEPHYSLTVVALAHYLGITPQEVIDRYAQRLETTDLTIAGSPYAFSAVVGRIAFCGSDLAAASTLDEPAEDPESQSLYASLGRPVPVAPKAKMAKFDVPPISDFIQVWPVQDILNTPDEELPGLFGVHVDPLTKEETPNQTIALLGVNVPGGYDIKMSDVGSISGVSIHANIMWNLMQGTFLQDLSTRYAAVFILGLALLATAVATYFEAKWACAVFLLLCYGYWYEGYQLMYSTYFSSGGVIIPIFTPWLGALASFGAVTIRNVLVERNARQTMHNALADVLPVPDIEDWVNNRGFEIGSEERTLTILFSDIRGYTDLSETLNPVDITEMLNTYHEAMGSIFERYGGIIFDYQGDAQMVVFGIAPASLPNHAACAVKAASGMVLRLEQLRSEWKAQKRPVFECGVGVCTGSVALGVVGSKYRKQICAIGDPTNTSARMQGKSKELNCPVLMTESTYLAAGDAISAHYLQSVSVKGKREPLRVYGVNLDEMRTLLHQDGLNTEEIIVVMLVASWRQDPPDEEGSKQKLIQALEAAIRPHSGLLVTNSSDQAVTAVFGGGSFNRNNHALEALASARSLLQEYQEQLFVCLHTGYVNLEDTEPSSPCNATPPAPAPVSTDISLSSSSPAPVAQSKRCRIKSEAWNMALDISKQCRGLSTPLIATEAVLPAWGNEVDAKVVSTYKVPHKKQRLGLYSVPLE